MGRQLELDAAAGPPFVSTGRLPPAEQVRELVAQAHRRFQPVAEGRVSAVYPALASAPGHLFGIGVVDTSGSVYAAGDAGHAFTIMSVSKPFVFALICELLGADEARLR